MRRNSSPTDRSENFSERLKETMNSENDPELVTPWTAGAEEVAPKEDIFPLVKTFKQTNMRGTGGKGGSQKGLGRDAD